MKKYPKQIAQADIDLPAPKQAEEDKSIIDSNSRRDFLKTLGFTFAGASFVSSCQKPIEKAIPYLVRPEKVVPGKASYFASTYFEENEYCNIVVKVRDGRPIKIEGNEKSPLSKGGTSQRVQASVLNLYDPNRYNTPTEHGEATTNSAIDQNILQRIEKLKAENKPVAILSSSIISPTTIQLISKLKKRYNNIEWIEYDTQSYHGMLTANSENFGIWAIPKYQFDKAKIVVAIGADFLGTWLDVTSNTKQYSQLRDPDLGNNMSRHYQIESNLSLTGSNADERITISPSQQPLVLIGLYNALAEKANQPTINTPPCPVNLDHIANDLINSKGKSLIICNSNDKQLQLIVNQINIMLNNYGNTIDLNTPNHCYKGNDNQLADLQERLFNKKLGGLITLNVNPVYDLPEGGKWEKAIKELPLSVAFAERTNETAECCNYIIPKAHHLESWEDAIPYDSHYSITQPTIVKNEAHRATIELLSDWLKLNKSAHQLISEYWADHVATPNSSWEKCLKEGIYIIDRDKRAPISPKYVDFANFKFEYTNIDGYQLELYQMVGKGNGMSANNPWLIEMPDPISKVSWDNFAAVSPSLANQLQVATGDIVKINGSEFPLFIQPAMDNNTIALAIGFGRKVGGKVAEQAGKNAYPFVTWKNGTRKYSTTAQIKKTDKSYPLALTQTHADMKGREIVRESYLNKYKTKQSAGNEAHKKHEKHKTTLYNELKFPNHHWAMIVDLNKCIGCGNCELSCQAENNVAVIGKEQVQKRRIMHWMRIDRYYNGTSVVHQPVMCQQCDNAPCENVCPVSATVHSNEGINQMAYNRCVGTRYCINNCPYRTRRFNWFKYANNKQFDFNQNDCNSKLVLNPDVTVRSRGVVEKCSFCIQRIQEKKLEAKIEKRPIVDGEVKPACVQSCPADALVFGDLNDPKSAVSKLIKHPRNYHLLEELHTLPSVGYLTKIRNPHNSKSHV